MDIALTHIGNILIEGYRGDYVFETIEKTGDYYESTILNKWSPILSKSNVIFDVGSNLGNHAIYWATRLQPSVIYAFEPYPDNFSRLKNNVIINKLNNVIIPIQKGVGDHSGYASINYVDETNLGGTSIAYTDENQESEIQIIDLDSFSKKKDINTVDFVKIDAEGFEISVLQGMRDLIMKCHPDIWVEVSYTTYLEVINFLQNEGYILHDIEQFNLLFLHHTRHSKIEKIDNNKIMDGFFKYLERTNHYYKAYNTSKKWLEDRNKAFEKLKIEYKRQTELMEEQNEALIQLKDSYQKQSQVLEKGNVIQNELLVALKDDFDIFDSILNELNSIKEFVRKLQTQNSYLTAENQEYRRKFNKITGTWYGRILIKSYKLLQRVKKAFNK